MAYTIQNNPDQCTGCQQCLDACPSNALEMADFDSAKIDEKNQWEFFEKIPELDRKKIDETKVSQQQLQEPLFKYSLGVEGCGEAPYLKLVSQLFGNRLIVANATGASSIFGGALPTTPWSTNNEGKGPAWSNSLFEDNAEFGLGFRLSENVKISEAQFLIHELRSQLDFDLTHDILNATQLKDIDILEQEKRVDALKQQLEYIEDDKAKRLVQLADSLVKKSIWIIGGDGWAYDIGYGGLDHVIASGENVNILVLDNEVYDNTGGQASKATPYGASAKFSFNCKQKQKKDLGLMAMTYEDVYVATVAIGADQSQTLKVFNEAEQFDGPSIIIAYTHSSSHGIDISKPQQYHQAAVNSGVWPLYRRDPSKEKPFQLDSSQPYLSVADYLSKQKRFDKLFQLEETDLKTRLNFIQTSVNRRFKRLLKM